MTILADKKEYKSLHHVMEKVYWKLGFWFSFTIRVMVHSRKGMHGNMLATIVRIKFLNKQNKCQYKEILMLSVSF